LGLEANGSAYWFTFEKVEDTRRIGGLRTEESEFILGISGIELLSNRYHHMLQAERSAVVFSNLTLILIMYPKIVDELPGASRKNDFFETLQLN